MIARFLSFVILVPLAILLVVFCVANRGAVMVSLDPFGTLPQYEFQVPLFILLMAAVILGTVLGGIGTWFTQGHYRRRSARRRAELESLRREADDAKERLRRATQERPLGAPASPSTALVAARPV